VGAAPDLLRLAGELGVERQRIGRREDGDRVDAERRGRPGDPDGDLAAIGDQDPLEHFISPRFLPAPHHPIGLLSPARGRGWVRGKRTSLPPHLTSPPSGGEEFEFGEEGANYSWQAIDAPRRPAE